MAMETGATADIITTEERRQPQHEVPPGLDGETSPQTQQIAGDLGAAGFALNCRIQSRRPGRPNRF